MVIANSFSRLEDTSLAVWGGQLEIRALAASLRRVVTVFDAEAPTLTMGDGDEEADGRPPLLLSYHRHYFALGEHYNSVVVANDAHPS